MNTNYPKKLALKSCQLCIKVINDAVISGKLTNAIWRWLLKIECLLFVWITHSNSEVLTIFIRAHLPRKVILFYMVYQFVHFYFFSIMHLYTLSRHRLLWYWALIAVKPWVCVCSSLSRDNLKQTHSHWPRPVNSHLETEI